MPGEDMARRTSSAPTRRTSIARSAMLAVVSAGLCGAGPASAQSSAVTVTISLTVTATATVDTAKVQAATRTAIQGLMADRARFLTSNGPDTARIHSRLSGGSLVGGGGGASAGFTDGDVPKPATNARASLQRDLGAAGGASGLGSDIFGSDVGGGPLSRYGRQAGRGGLPLSGDEPFAEHLGVGRDASTDRPVQRGAMPFRLSGNSEDGTGRFAFATSLSQVRAAVEAQEREKLAVGAPARASAATAGGTPTSGTLGTTALGASPMAPVQRAPPTLSSVDVWVEGSSAYFTNDRVDGHRSGHASVVYAGGDVILMPGLLVGVMGQIDWMADSGTGASGVTAGAGALARDGHGWMAGPYLAARLTPHLYFDTRAAWGRSTNHVDPLGAYEDEFGATRMLAAAKLTGDWSFGHLRLRPSAEVIWFRETSDAYVNAIGIDIDKQRYDLGRFTLGPEAGYRFDLGPHASFEPFVGIKGVWDFARTTEATAAGDPVSGDTMHGRIEAGVNYMNAGGISVRASGQYEGLGSSTGYRAVQGRAQLVVPLQ